jgi:hypothetical protein
MGIRFSGQKYASKSQVAIINVTRCLQETEEGFTILATTSYLSSTMLTQCFISKDSPLCDLYHSFPFYKQIRKLKFPRNKVAIFIDKKCQVFISCREGVFTYFNPNNLSILDENQVKDVNALAKNGLKCLLENDMGVEDGNNGVK